MGSVACDISIAEALTADSLLVGQRDEETKNIFDDILGAHRNGTKVAHRNGTKGAHRNGTKVAHRNGTKVAPYLNSGYLKNVYNAELCDNKWLIMVHLINELRDSFLNFGKFKIKSLHLHCVPGAELAAMHHYLYNSDAAATSQVDWKWVGTVSAIVDEDQYSIRKAMKRKYCDNILKLLNAELYAVNNINYVVNETLNRLGRVGLICISRVDNSVADFMTYALFSIKLLDADGICYINIADPSSGWSAETFTGVVLMGLIFREMHLYRFDSDGLPYAVLICKKKKKISSEIIYKKIISILDNLVPASVKSYSLFTADYLRHILEEAQALQNLLSGEDDARIINCADIIQNFENILKMNVDMFL